MDEQDKPTYEQLAYMVEQRDRDIAKAHETIRDKEADLKRLRLVLRGIGDSQFHIKVTLSPEIFDRNSFDAVQHLVRHHAKYTCAEIEAKLGGPLRRLQEAVMHIHYLENHAASRGVQFTPWAVNDRDRELYY